MENKKDIVHLDDIILMVDSFYGKVQKDELLAPIFSGIIQDRWPIHLAKMYKFWETVLLDNHSYFGSPFRPHARLPVSQEHFDRWKFMFYETLDENFKGPKADEARWRAGKMAEMFMMKINHINNDGLSSII